jgi:hypothetical protein
MAGGNLLLCLDLTQRLNLWTLIGAQSVAAGPGMVARIRAFCHLHDLVALSDEEKEAVGYQEVVSGQGQLSWQCKPGAQLPPRQLELSPADVVLLRQAVEAVPGVVAMRRWAEPIWNALFPLGAPSGEGSSQ